MLPGRLGVCRLPAGEPVPAWIAGAEGFVSVTRTRHETSLVCPESFIPSGVRAERGWRGLEVEGPLAFGLTGVLSSLLAPLAHAQVGVFALSTFDTDYILVKEETLAAALAALRAAGHQIDGT